MFARLVFSPTEFDWLDFYVLAAYIYLQSDKAVNAILAL
jgi:hypothetical protein